jgi:hypothetical protein
MATLREPSADAVSLEPSTTEQPPVTTTSDEPVADALGGALTTTEQQPAETVSISVGVEKGMVVMAVTPAEAAALERRRIQESRGRLLRLMPRDWTTPLALLIPLLAALVTNISDQGVRVGFVAATVLAVIWLILSVTGRVVDALNARSDQQHRPFLQ